MFSELLKSLRFINNISQTKLAKEIRVSPGNISDWESGRSKPGYTAIASLARYFHVTADFLLELEEENVNTGCDLSDYKVEQGLTCDGSPLDDEEADLVAMYRLLPDHKKEDAFDIIYTLYQKHVERKMESIYWTYAADRAEQKGTAGSDGGSQGGIA